MKHREQVDAGLIPKDSPPDFVRPEGDDAQTSEGLPWWFGEDFHPTPEALKSFEEPVPGHPANNDGGPTPLIETSQTKPEP